ncbi:hypothetical protein DXG03_001038 [Asterophora parasitica]|uniref:Uncharacterized protein n=1 Tax=Asterophora parasitica TaxID=117018 RepID=A0A9P7G5B2_9AGAR|nr:hypothetical protein DXG03_001038 [Asterophora parasitica]
MALQPVNVLHHFMLHANSTYDCSKPVSTNNVPYNVVPVLRRQIASPVRLFSNYHMAVGSRGTAVWIDSHAEDYFKRGDCGQRLAGSLQGAGISGPRANDEGDGRGMESSTEMGSAKWSSVFGYCENDQWTRVAVDEEEGRIAVGYMDGTIRVHEYA